MDTRTLEWNWRGETIRLGTDASGTGPKVLLLPALSSISSRREMQALQERLAPRYSTLSVDWPGFGEGARPQLDWRPDTYAAFLAWRPRSRMTSCQKKSPFLGAAPNLLLAPAFSFR